MAPLPTTPRALFAAAFSLSAPLGIALLTTLMPAGKSWHFTLAIALCISGIAAAGWAIKHRGSNATAVVPLAVLGILANLGIGLISLLFASMHSAHP